MTEDERRARPRLTKAERRRQLLDTAMSIVRADGADRLTLGHLAHRANISKPVVYEHFATRSHLLIELYRWIDVERVEAFRVAMSEGERSRRETIDALAAAFIACAADGGDEFHAVGAALAGSEEKARVYRELFDNVVDMFAAVLLPFLGGRDVAPRGMCVALVGAGEALADAVIRETIPLAEAIAIFKALIGRAIGEPDGPA